MTPIRFSPEVPDELAEAAIWYETKRVGLGAEFLAEVEAVLPLFESRPRSFPRLERVGPTLEVRRALLARFPYALVFLVLPEELRVLAIAHAKRRPGYWLSRLRTD